MRQCDRSSKCRQSLRDTGEADTLVVIDLYDYPDNHTASTVSRLLRASGLPVKTFQLDASDHEPVYDHVLDATIADARVVVNIFVSVGVRKDRIFLPEVQSNFITRLFEKSNRVIIASLGSPYIAQAFPTVPTYICAYNNSYLMQTALVNALLGYREVGGRLPVNIPTVCNRGCGLDLPLDSLAIAEPLLDTLVIDHGIFAPPAKDLTLRRVMPSELGATTGNISKLLNQAVADTAWPGGVLLAVKDGRIFYHEAFGYHTYHRENPVRRGDIFDLASITKAVATTSAAMKLQEEGRLSLKAKVVSYISEFRGPTTAQTRLKSGVTIRHLLTHTSGLPRFRQFWLMGGSIATRLDSVYATQLDTLPRVQMIYSDIGMILLAKVIERISGQSLDTYLDSVIFKPLGMNSTYFNPPAEREKRFIPTEYSEELGDFVRGQVHDENSGSLGGVAGHAGLFSTAADLAIFAQMMLNRGVYRDSVIYRPETVALFTSPKAGVVPGSSRCLGWDSPAGEASAGIYADSKSFGHTGFTGTSLWIDPENRIIVILLTNAVHPHRSYKYPKYFDWRQRIHSAVYEALPDPKSNPELILKARWQAE